jgi:hypothetical protein
MLAAGGCLRRPEPAPAAEERLEGQWFQLLAGVFEPVEGLHGLRNVESEPWTVQARVSDLAELDGTLFLAVNGYGLAALDLPPSAREPPRFRYFYDSTLFRYRTLTTLIPQAGSLLCHLYFNRLLNVTVADSLPVRGLCLLRLHPSSGIYQVVQVPFAVTHPDWECVGFAPQTPNQVLLEWKYSGAAETRFQYTRCSLLGLEEQPSDRGEYRRAWQPIPVDRRLPEALQELFREAVRREGAVNTALHFVMRTAGEPLARRYAHTPPGYDRAAQVSLVTLHGFQDAERLRLLSPRGLLLETDSTGDAPVRIRRLPALPGGFAYTDLFAVKGLLLAIWEQNDFIRTGASGVLISGEL